MKRLEDRQHGRLAVDVQARREVHISFVLLTIFRTRPFLSFLVHQVSLHYSDQLFLRDLAALD